MSSQPRFTIGQTVHHKKFDYRGVIVDVDPEYAGSEEWYETVATSRPPRDAPWYTVLVHEAHHVTYVAERHLEPDESGEQIDHPALGEFFDRFSNGRYYRSRTH